MSKLDPHGGYQLKLVGSVRKKLGGCKKSLGTPMTCPEGQMPGWGFWGGAAQCATSPSATRCEGELSLPCPHPSPNPLPHPSPKKSLICTNPVAMPVDSRGGGVPPCAPPPWLRYWSSLNGGRGSVKVGWISD